MLTKSVANFQFSDTYAVLLAMAASVTFLPCVENMANFYESLGLLCAIFLHAKPIPSTQPAVSEH